MNGATISVNEAVRDAKWYECWYETGFLGSINVKFISFNMLDPADLVGDYAHIYNQLDGNSVFMMTVDVIPLSYAPFNRLDTQSMLSSYIKIVGNKNNIYIDSLIDGNCEYDIQKGSEIYCIQNTAFTQQFGLLRFDRSVKVPNCAYRATLAYVLPTKDPSDYYIYINLNP